MARVHSRMAAAWFVLGALVLSGIRQGTRESPFPIKDAVFLNPRRFWMMDRMWLYNTGETLDFDGVKATWMATLLASMPTCISIRW